MTILYVHLKWFFFKKMLWKPQCKLTQGFQLYFSPECIIILVLVKHTETSQNCKQQIKKKNFHKNVRVL